MCLFIPIHPSHRIAAADLLDLHGGTVGVISEGEGKGSTFYFELPLFEKRQSVGNMTPTPNLPEHRDQLAIQTALLDERIRSSRYSYALLTGLTAPFKQRKQAEVVPISHEFNDADGDALHVVTSRNRKKGFADHAIRFVRVLMGSQFMVKHNETQPSTELMRSVDDAVSFTNITDWRRKSAGDEEEGNCGADSIAVDTSAVQRDALGMSQPFGRSPRHVRQGAYSPAHREAPSLGGLKVLIVDDAVTTRRVMRRLFATLGHAVEEAADGVEFLQKMGVLCFANAYIPINAANDAPGSKEEDGEGEDKEDGREQGKRKWPEYDVILIDDNMPNMSGPDATAAVRNAGYRGLIFGVTGNTFASQQEEFRRKGADVVFCKPLDVKAMEAAVRERMT
jgi:CheY-like chemotaxis protein